MAAADDKAAADKTAADAKAATDKAAADAKALADRAASDRDEARTLADKAAEDRAEAAAMLAEAKAHREAADKAANDSSPDPTRPVVIAEFRTMKEGGKPKTFSVGEVVTREHVQKYFPDQDTFKRRVLNRFISVGGLNVE